MPRYFFDSHDGDLLFQDMEGLDLPDREAARVQALAGLASIAEDVATVGDTCNCYVNVRNEAGIAIYTACMARTGRWLD